MEQSPSCLLINLFSIFLAWVLVLSSAFQVCFWRGKVFFFFLCVEERKICYKVIYSWRNLVSFNCTVFGRKIDLFHLLEISKILLKKNVFLWCMQIIPLFMGNAYRLYIQTFLLPHDSFSVKLIAFNVMVYVYKGILSNSYIQ